MIAARRWLPPAVVVAATAVVVTKRQGVSRFVRDAPKGNAYRSSSSLPRVCLACSNPKRKEIDQAIIQGSPSSRIASDVGVGEYVIRRHRKLHLLPTLNNARTAQEKLAGQSPADAVLKEARRPLDLLMECESLLRIAQSLLARAAQEKRYGPAVAAVGQAARLLDLLGHLQGDLSPAGVTEISCETE